MSNLPSPVYTDTLKRLLQGEVLCPWSTPEQARLLQDSEVRSRVDEWVRALGYELAETSGGAGDYLVHTRVGEPARADTTRLFREIMVSLREHLNVINLLMEATDADAALAPGQVIRPNQVVAAAEVSPSLRDQLGKLKTSKPQSGTRQQVDALIKTMKDEGLLVPARQDGEVYSFTGRVELIQDIIVFIQENEELPLPGHGADSQKYLL